MDVARRQEVAAATAVHRASVAGLGPRLDYRSMISVEDMPELFVSFESELSMFTIKICCTCFKDFITS
jgi:hypothetical protein